MPAINGIVPVLSNPADALEGGLAGQPVSTPTVLSGARPGVISTYNVPVTAGFIGAFEIDGEVVASASPGATEFSRDLVSVDPTDGSITVTAGTHTTDQIEANAAKPALPAGDVELFTMLADSSLITEIEQAARGTGLATVLTIEVSAGVLDGVAFEAETLTMSLAGSSEFSRDRVTVDPANGDITLTAGADTTDQTAGSAVAPDAPGVEVVLFDVLMTDAAISAEEYGNRGSGIVSDPVLTVASGAGLFDGVYVAASSQVFGASTGSNFAKDLVSIDAAGAISITAGVEAASAGLAVVPDVPAGEYALYFATVSNAANGVTAISMANRGQYPQPSDDGL